MFGYWTTKNGFSSSSSAIFRNLRIKFAPTAMKSKAHKTVGPNRSSYLTARRFLIIAALHKNIPIAYITNAMATNVNPNAALIATASPKLRRPAAMAPRTIPASYQDNKHRSLAKYTFGSTRTGTAIPDRQRCREEEIRFPGGALKR